MGIGDGDGGGNAVQKAKAKSVSFVFLIVLIKREVYEAVGFIVYETIGTFQLTVISPVSLDMLILDQNTSLTVTWTKSFERISLLSRLGSWC